mmetsp:Transcript_6647/g.14556  ORF Transcript_6647/g.14556 Transcript_6647/m.14556 type:complete len:517 (+) Transcript_6647:33-1583(+)
MGGQGAITSASRTASILSEKYLQPLRSIAEKFTLYEQLVEHVVDMGSLPELKVNHQHDQELGEIAEKQQELQVKAERILHEARSTWGSFADVKMEQNGKDGFILRTTRGDDERQLRANCSSVKVLSILKNGVHFTTTALEKLADRYLSLEAEYEEKQSTLVTQALDTARTYLPVVEAVANLIAELDVLASFATAAALSPGVYVRPIVHPRGADAGVGASTGFGAGVGEGEEAEKGVGGSIDLRGARHPCVELMDGVQQFIANDYDLIRGKSTFQIVTGPNMGGKSTYIRAVGCIVVLAQIGMYVPCDSAELSVSDCILARVGAGDAVQKGVSTFMAEMLESSVMLQTASSDSLIIIDELGRGTSTFDGFGLAWSISDYIVKQLRCKCLFATHFHELTALQKAYPTSVTNKHVSAHISDNSVVMLYQLAPGPCTQSFGIHVAATADFPQPVIAAAKRKAASLEGSDSGGAQKLAKKRDALDVFGALDASAGADPQMLVDGVRGIAGVRDALACVACN